MIGSGRPSGLQVMSRLRLIRQAPDKRHLNTLCSTEFFPMISMRLCLRQCRLLQPMWQSPGPAVRMSTQAARLTADTVGPEVKSRDSFLLTYFVDQGPLRYLRNRSKRFGNFLLDELRNRTRRPL